MVSASRTRGTQRRFQGIIKDENGAVIVTAFPLEIVKREEVIQVRKTTKATEIAAAYHNAAIFDFLCKLGVMASELL